MGSSEGQPSCAYCGATDLDLGLVAETSMLAQYRLRCTECGAKRLLAFRRDGPAPSLAMAVDGWREQVRSNQATLAFFFAPRIARGRADGADPRADLVEALLREVFAAVFRRDTTDWRFHPDGFPGLERPLVAWTAAVPELRRIALDAENDLGVRLHAAIGLAAAAVVAHSTGGTATGEAVRAQRLESVARADEWIEWNGERVPVIPPTRAQVDEENPHLLETLRRLQRDAAFARIGDVLELALAGTAPSDPVRFVTSARQALVAAARSSGEEVRLEATYSDGIARELFSLRHDDSPEADRLWCALDRAALAIEEHPDILRAKDPNWDRGLNAAEINELAFRKHLQSGRVFDLETRRQPDGYDERILTIRHPSGSRPVVFVLTSFAGDPGPATIARGVANLRAWRDERAAQLATTGGSDWYTLGVYGHQVATTRVDEPEHRDRVRTLAMQMEAAANRAGLAALTSENWAVYQAVSRWLVGARGYSASAAIRLPVADVVRLLEALAAENAARGGPEAPHVGALRKIIDSIDRIGQGLEAAPGKQVTLGEEGIRDGIVAGLRGAYGEAATSETFSKLGKTDIRVALGSGASLVGECKFWDGPRAYAEALEQTFRYLTWRHEMAALITFVTTREITKVVAKAQREAEAHPTFRAGSLVVVGRSRFVTRHRHPQDDDLDLEVTHLFFDLSVPGAS